MSESKTTKKRDLGVLWGPAFAGREGGFVKVPPDVIGLLKRRARLTANEVLLFIAIQSFRREGAPDELPFPGTDRLAEMIGSDRGTVQEALDKMEAKGLGIQRGTQGRGNSNRYDVRSVLDGLLVDAAEDEVAEERNDDTEPTAAEVCADEAAADDVAAIEQLIIEAEAEGDVDSVNALMEQLEAFERAQHGAVAEGVQS